MSRFVPNILARLGATAGAALIGFVQAGVSAVARSVLGKLLDMSLSPLDFGGIGDGTPHPLSERFGTLAKAQAVYPFATALTQQIDWCAVYAMCLRQKITNQPVDLLVKNWYVVDPLPQIATATAQDSTTKGNFRFMGASMHNSILTFNIASDAAIAMEFVANASGMKVGDFRVVNLYQQPGTGLKNFATGVKFSGSYTTEAGNIHAFNFDKGIDKTSYVSVFGVLVGANCNCGVYNRDSTSTNNLSVYGASCRRQAGETRNYDYIGAGVYVAAGRYTKFTSCASDDNDIAYMVKSTLAYSGSNAEIAIEFDNCGAESCSQAFYIDAPRAAVTIRRPFLVNIGSGKLAHVENAQEVTIHDYCDNQWHQVTLGANVGPGVVRFEGANYGTGGNPAFYPPNIPTVDDHGVGDFAYKGLCKVGGAWYSRGKLLTVGNSLEFEVYARSNGLTATAKIEVLPWSNKSGANVARAGTIWTQASNSAGYIELGDITSTNPNIKVTETAITDGGGNHIGRRYLIEPFFGLALGATTSTALFRVETMFNPVGTDGNGKNHNIKLAGAYTGRVNCRLKGVDY